MPLANIDMEGKYVKMLFNYEEAQKAAQEEELKTSRLINTLDEKRKLVSVISFLNNTVFIPASFKNGVQF